MKIAPDLLARRYFGLAIVVKRYYTAKAQAHNPKN
jgi:hypothetical protein